MSEFKLTRRPLLERARMFGMGDEVEALIAAKDALSELHDIVHAILDGEINQHKLDSFTLQPTRIALAALRAAGIHEGEGK